MRRIHIAVALSTLLLVSISSAQQAATGKPANTPKSGVGIDTVVNCANAKNNYIPVFTSAAPPNITICNSAIFQANGNIGIGTTTPAAALDVSGSISATSNYQIFGSTVLSILGGGNLFFGLQAGTHNNGGTGNTLFGNNAGFNNTTGGLNTFVGSDGGMSNTTGSFDTFVGANAGSGNTTGAYNTFSGTSAGVNNTSGSFNTFGGYASGANNTVGIQNTFLGADTGIISNANDDTFLGYASGATNSGGYSNTFVGSKAGTNNDVGNSDTFVGIQAGYSNTSGSFNTFVGTYAGINNTTGSNNIYIANEGLSPGTESNTLRIGRGQSAAYVSGVYSETSPGGIAVYINGDGQLGTTTSCIRFKEQVRDMGDSSDALMKLRPVTFLYKPEYANGERSLQYGLIAEEVAKVYPELVAYDKDGQPYAVRYQYLSTILLNEVQEQYHRAEAEAEVITAQEEKIEQLEQRLSRLEGLVRAQVQTVAQARQ
jgi:hypothetical protein